MLRRSLKCAARHVLVVDSDSSNPKMWAAAKEVVARRGLLLESLVVLKPGGGNWAAEAQRLGMQAVPVSRRAGGKRDPCDIAVGLEVGRAMDSADTVALLVNDADFSHIASRLKALGKRCVAVLVEGKQPNVEMAFKEAGAEVAHIAAGGAASPRRPRNKAVLQADGEAVFAEITEADREELDRGLDQERLLELRRLLHELEYVVSPEDPPVPAIAKCFHVNGLGPVAVWPPALAKRHAAAVLLAGGRWRRNVGNLAFVLPTSLAKATKSKSTLKRYGTAACRTVMEGGGPFLMRSSPRLVDAVLERLGYLDTELNADFAEAADVFARRVDNYRALRGLSVDVQRVLDVDSKRALLHGALVSSRHYGVWNTAPKDTSLRQFLYRKGFIPELQSPRAQVLEALRAHASANGLQALETYNAHLVQLGSFLNPEPPEKRRP